MRLENWMESHMPCLPLLCRATAIKTPLSLPLQADMSPYSPQLLPLSYFIKHFVMFSPLNRSVHSNLQHHHQPHS